MRYRVETDDAAALVEGGGRGRLVLELVRPVDVIAAWMNVLGPGEAESGRVAADAGCLFYVVSGLVLSIVDGREGRFAAGESFVAQAEERFRLSNAGDGELRVLEMELPSRSEPFDGGEDTCSDKGPRRRGEE